MELYDLIVKLRTRIHFCRATQASWLVWVALFVQFEIMHRSVAFDADLHRAPIVEHLSYLTLDIGLLFLLWALLCRWRVKWALCGSFITGWIWSCVQIIYARFFKVYLPFSVMGESGNLVDPLLINSIVAGLHWYDAISFCTLAIGIWGIVRADRKTRVSWRHLLIGLCVVLGVTTMTTKLKFPVDVYNKITDYERCQQKMTLWNFELQCDIYAHGFFFSQLYYESRHWVAVKELKPEEVAEISDFVGQHDNLSGLFEDSCRYNPQHIFFLLIESYLSVTSDLTVGNKEITPFLNRLKRAPETYYNGEMKSQIAIGESSDGQFLYLNGLLPLSLDLTVNALEGKQLRSLPYLLKKADAKRKTMMTIPTSRYIWRQQALCETYGIDTLYSAAEHYCTDFVNDAQVFDYALQQTALYRDSCTFEMILSLSTHNPYDEAIAEAEVFDFPSHYPVRYCHYLQAVNYMDRSLEAFTDSLKQWGIYDESLIVICSDHEAHAEMLGMPAEQLNNLFLPLYLVNAPKMECHEGEFEQIDLFSTMVDLLVSNAAWSGLGCSLYRREWYRPLSRETKQYYSNKIINGNYFGYEQEP